MITIYIFYKYFLPTLCSNMRSVFVRQNVLGTFAECSQNVRRMFAECSQTIKCVGIGSAIMNHSAGLLAVFCPPFEYNGFYRLEPPTYFRRKGKSGGFLPTQSSDITQVKTPQKRTFGDLFYSMRDYWRYFASPWNNGTLQTRLNLPV